VAEPSLAVQLFPQPIPETVCPIFFLFEHFTWFKWFFWFSK
jgi:hypothetical protein